MSRRAVSLLLATLCLLAVAAPALGRRTTARTGAKAKVDVLLGRKLFRSNCGTCHTLAPAGTHGHIGPNLGLDIAHAATVAWMMRTGNSTMPSFVGTLTPAQIADVAGYVAQVAGR
ncbi:MAG TPA: cytochrome c [Gaiellaceae bacterium]|jgi:mono/diheme cytochrome c family protein